MKKLITLFAFIFAGYMMQAQLNPGNILINGGIGFLTYQQGINSIPPLSLSAEYMVSDKISVGAEGGYYALNFEQEINFPGNLEGDTQATTSYKMEGSSKGAYGAVLGNFYFLNDYKYNVYLGGRLGYVNYQTEMKSTMDDGEEVTNVSMDFGPQSGLLIGAVVGGRYMATDNIGVFAELGYGISVLKIGVTYKIGY